MTYSLNCRGQLLDLSTPIVMGILNVTPDSFHDGGRYQLIDAAVLRAEQMLAEGASLLDVGGMSTRPNANFLSADEELRRLLPVLQALVKRFPGVPLSVDTFRAEVARVCIHEGATMVNDVSGGRLDEAMMEVVGSFGNVPYVWMHSRGTPDTMQQMTDYEDVVSEVLDAALQGIAKARSAGIRDIIVDPGFGFAKSVDQNYKILNNLHIFGVANVPILAGLSRKSMIYKYLDTDAAHALNGTTVLNTMAILQGTSILRVHDVREAQEVIRLVRFVKSV